MTWVRLCLFLSVGVLASVRPTPRRNECVVARGRADCSHMNLKSVPADLPHNITALDLSHNRLTALQATELQRYAALLELDVGFNSLTGLGRGPCDTLPRLRRLSVQRNEVHLLSSSDLVNCTQLTHLDLSDNRLRAKDEPFSVLENLTWLDVSRNKLTSARLGSTAQLPGLVTLVLSGNNIAQLKKDDFSFLVNSSSFRVLGLSSLPLKTVEPGCFRPIAGLRDLVLDGCKLSPSVLTKLCEELTDTAVRNLSLQNAQQVTLLNETFKGLNKTNVTTLDLSNNKMSKISNGTFRWLPQLEVLSLQHNNLKLLNRGTFLGLKNLKELNLRTALVKSKTSALPVIEDFSFQPLVKLERLYVENATFKDLAGNIFAGLPSLRILDLSWSKTGLKTFDNNTFASLQGSPLLRTLNLTAMGITKLDPGAFSSLGQLTNLLLSHNYIAQTLMGEEFRGLNSIEKIDLSFNQQRIVLKTTSFVYMPTLKTLLLGRALTGSLEPSPFTPLVKLRVLDLSNNNIANIDNSLLEGLYNLTVLKMQHNNLARVWKDANPGGPVLFLRDARNLTVLELDYNGLDEVPTMAFRGLSQLKELSLSGNLLNYLHDSIFNDLRSLRYLHLSKNLLTTVRQETFGVPFSNLSELHMDHNPFDCTCESILWFSQWLNGTNTSVPNRKQSYICNTPSLYFNRSVLAFDTLSCKDLTPFQALYVLNSTLVLGLMVVAFLVHFQGWRIQFYWSIVVHRTLGMKDSGSDGQTQDRYLYDAYIIYADDDEPWVKRSLLPLEKGGFVFFMEGRDSIPGDSKLETIEANMKKSRKIIFVVTDALLNDEWCKRYKSHLAIIPGIEESRDSLILIYLQDVSDFNLNRSLHMRRGMFKSRCVLRWPLQKERIVAFHQKLRLALASSNRVG